MATVSNDRITVQQLRTLVRLDATTGHLYWLARPREAFKTEQAFGHFTARVGQRADLTEYATNGYARVRFRHPTTGERIEISAHRAVFALVHGRWPDLEVDHVDGNRTNNRPANLRELPHAANMQAAAQRRAAQAMRSGRQ